MESRYRNNFKEVFDCIASVATRNTLVDMKIDTLDFNKGLIKISPKEPTLYNKRNSITITLDRADFKKNTFYSEASDQDPNRLYYMSTVNSVKTAVEFCITYESREK